MTQEGSFEQLYESTREGLLRYFLRRVDEPTDAADLLADVYLVAWRHRDQSRTDPRLWLFGVARNMLAAHHRGKRAQRALASRLRQQVVDQYEPSLGQLYVREILDRLPPRDREVIELTVYEQLTPTEIAIVLGKSPGSVRVRLHRARQRLQVELAEVDREVNQVNATS